MDIRAAGAGQERPSVPIPGETACALQWLPVGELFRILSCSLS